MRFMRGAMTWRSRASNNLLRVHGVERARFPMGGSTEQGENANQRGTHAIVSVRIVGTPVSVISLDGALKLFEAWAVDRRGRSVVLRDVHGVMRARSDAALRKAHESSDLVAPDGLPLVW